MMKKILFIAAFVVCSLASVWSVSAQTTVKSEPTGTRVFINGKELFEMTPYTFAPKGSKFTVELKKAGYEDAKLVVAKEVDPAGGKKKVYPAEVNIKMTMTSSGTTTNQGSGNHEEDPRYGDTREQRILTVKKLNFLSDEVNNRNWAEAAIFVKELMNEAPTAPNIYIWGATVYKNKAARARSLAEKKELVDSLMLIYDRRAQHQAVADPTRTVSYILQMKARDYAALNPMDREGVRTFYMAAVDASGGKPTGDLVVEYFQQLVNDYKAYEIETELLLAEYDRLSGMMDGATDEMRGNFNTLFAQSGAATCEILEGLYAKELAPDPENLEVLTKAYNLMSMINCTSDFYVSVAEKYYSKAPSTAIAIRLATVFENRQEFARALKYLNEILPTEKDPTAKATIYLRIAASELGAKHSSAAAAAARSAIEINPDNGNARFILAQAYMSGAAACGGFHAQTVFWLAYDELARARQSLSGDSAMLSAIESSMASCRANFPTFEEGFMYLPDYADGKSYTVSCGWISGSTTIRSR